MYPNLQNYITCLLVCSLLTTEAIAQNYCIDRKEIPDLITLGVYAPVDEIRTEHYAARNINGRWIADSLLYTRVAYFNSRGFYTRITEHYPDFHILNWVYNYQDDKLINIICDRDGYKRDMQTTRWITDTYYIRYVFPYDNKLGMFHLKASSISGYYFDNLGRLVHSYEAADDTCDKLTETTFVYEMDTVKMQTFNFRYNTLIHHTAIIVDKDDCGNPLQLVRNFGSIPVLEFYRYRYVAK